MKSPIPTMHILLAEDDGATAAFIVEGLGALGHTVDRVATGVLAIDRVAITDYDVIVLDRLMPDGDGMSVLAHLRQRRTNVPVLMLTALGALADRVEGLEAGADDYLVKPFAMPELSARITALHRHAARAHGAVPVVSRSWGRLHLDLLDRCATYDGQSVMLQPREFRLLEELVRADGQFLTRTMLIERIWNLHFDPKTNIVETHMSRLRARLAEVGGIDLIHTVRGSGYRMRSDI